MISHRIAALLAIAFLPLRTEAVLLTDLGSVPPSAPTIDFSQFASLGRIRFDTGDPPFVIDNLTNETVLLRPISGTSQVATILGNHTSPAHPDNNYYLGPNGHWSPNRVGFLGVGGGNGSIVTARIEFSSGPVSSVGGLMNYSPHFPSVILKALDKNLSIMEQYELSAQAPISTPSQLDAGAFRGIMRSTDDIFAIEITASFAVIDDIRFSRIIPEPRAHIATLPILFVALVYRAKRHG
jgi:hypothetical protein